MDILNYDKPTDEEVALVIDFWASVRNSLRQPGEPSLPSPEPSVLRRVAIHQQWQKAMTCTHPTITMDSDGISCGECDRPMRFLSDVQIADLKEN